MKNRKIRNGLFGILASVALLTGCGGVNLDGTYTTIVPMEVPYGDTVLNMDYYYTLALEGSTYDLILACDIGGGFAMTVGFVGEFTSEEYTVTLGAPTEYSQYNASFATNDDGSKTLTIDYDSKSVLSAEEATGSIEGVEVWVVNPEDGSMSLGE